MRVAPGRQARIATEIFDADIVATDESTLAVDNDNLPVIAEIELEAIDEALICRERMHLDPALEQRRDVPLRQIEAADAVVQEADPHALRRLRQQQRLELFAERVVADDEKLNQHVMARVLDRIDDRCERGLAVDERAHMIAGQKRHAGQTRERTHNRMAERIGRASHR